MEQTEETLRSAPEESAEPLGDKLSISAPLYGVYQYGNFDNAYDADGNEIDDKGAGAIGVDLEISYTPTERDEFFALLRFGIDNALNDIWPGPLAPFAHDLEDDLKDINGRNRDYLLAAWYKHTFDLDTSSLGLTGGIVDSTDYVDSNNFANDEMGAFMNDVFVNNPLANLPSYDPGAAAEFEIGPWGVNGLAMNSRTEEDSSYNYYALQGSYSYESSLGEEWIGLNRFVVRIFVNGEEADCDECTVEVKDLSSR